jgi:hypothetical protein
MLVCDFIFAGLLVWYRERESADKVCAISDLVVRCPIPRQSREFGRASSLIEFFRFASGTPAHEARERAVANAPGMNRTGTEIALDTT